jgi:hypothetical protein
VLEEPQSSHSYFRLCTFMPKLDCCNGSQLDPCRYKPGHPVRGALKWDCDLIACIKENSLSTKTSTIKLNRWRNLFCRPLQHRIVPYVTKFVIELKSFLLKFGLGGRETESKLSPTTKLASYPPSGHCRYHGVTADRLTNIQCLRSFFLWSKCNSNINPHTVM